MHITESARHRIVQVLKEDNLVDGKFRLYIRLSNATGFQYAYTIDNEVNEDDLIFEYEFQDVPIKVLIDSMSIQYLDGVTLDYKLQNDQESFVFIRPDK